MHISWLTSGVSLAGLAAALMLRWLLEPVLGESFALVTLGGAVALAVLCGGYVQAVLVAFLGFLACQYLFVEPRGRLAIEWQGFGSLGDWLAYAVICAIIIGLGQAARVVLRRGQRAIRRSEARKAAILETALDCIVMIDSQGRIVEFNPAAERAFGFRKAEVVGRDLAELIIPAKYRQSFQQSMAQHLITEEGLLGRRVEKMALRADGTEFPVELAITTIQQDDELHFAAYLRDLTSAKRVESRRLVQLAVTQILAEADTVTGATTRLLQTICDGLGWDMGVLWRPADSPGELRCVETWQRPNSHTPEFLAAMRQRTFSPDVGLLGRVWSSGQPVWIPDVVTEADACFPAATASREGIHAALAFPLTSSLARCGVIELFSRKVRPPDDDMLEMMATIGAQIGHFLDHREAEEEHARLAAIVEASDDAITSMTLDGVIRSWNGGAERLYGYSVSEAVGRHIDLIIPPEFRHQERMLLDRLRSGQRIEHFETVRVARDGRRIDVSLTFSPVFDPDGSIVGASKVARNISYRKKAEQALRESEERFRTIADSAPVLIWVTDGSDCTFVNRAYLDFLGLYDQTEVSGNNWARFLHPEDRARYMEAYLDCVARQARFVASFRFRRYDGEYRWMQSVAEPRLTPRGEFLGYTGCSFDVHDAHLATEALREADQRKNEFLATLAHELRNPLAPIRNSLEIMNRAAGNDQLVEQARITMDHQVSQMERLIDDLLDVARITRNRLELRNQRISVATVLRQAIEACCPLAEKARQSLDIQLPDEPIIVNADPVRLAQVFGNILNNACKYTDTGGRIRITAEQQGDAVAIAIQDSGIGIAPEKLESIFEMFSQVDRAMDRSQGGLGIGLTLVKRIVEMHGGTIEASSEGLGKGSTFVVRLPVSREHPDVEKPEPVEQLQKPPRRFLIVDDNVDAAMTLASLLGIAGHATYVAHDGNAALKAFGDHRPDVVLLDIGLPKIDGLEVCRRIRQVPTGHDVTLIALTGWGQDHDRYRSIEAGFDHHLVKPIKLDVLMTLLDDRQDPSAIGS